MQELEHISFNEEEHSYTNVKTKRRYISVTTLIKHYEAGYDGRYWSIYKGYQDYLGISDADKKKFSSLMMRNGLDFKQPCDEDNLIRIIKKSGLKDISKIEPFAKKRLDLWDANCKDKGERGTRFHKKEEFGAYQTGSMGFSTGNVKTNYSYSFDLSQLQDGGYSELLVYLHEFGIAGQVDKAKFESVGNITYVDIDDWKTNDKITTSNGFQKFKAPINHLEETKLNKYALQLSMYAYILECHGFVVRHLRFTHIVLDKDEVEVNRLYYVIPYLRNEVIAILNDYSSGFSL